MSDVVWFAAWTLAAPSMLGWVLLAGVPVLLHLLGKHAATTHAWGAMHLLRKAAAKQAKHYRLQKWLLLLTRVIAVLFLVLAWSQPTRWFPTPPQANVGRQLLVIVLDGSISMDYRLEQVSRFELAKKWARQRVESAPLGTAFSLVVMADPPQVVVRRPAFAAEDFLRELDLVEVTEGKASLATSMTEAERIVQEAQVAFPQLASAQVLCFTDLESSTWNSIVEGDAAEVSKGLAEKAPIRLYVVGKELDVSTPKSQVSNLAILNATTIPALVMEGDTFQIEVELANFDSQREKKTTVQLWAGGELLDETDSTIPAGGKGSCVLRGQARQSGDLATEIRIREDSFPADDIWYQTVTVVERLRLLAVEGAPQELFPFSTAITAGASGETFSIDRITEATLLDYDLPSYDAVVLGNPGELSKAEGDKLKRFVREGGGLILLLGSQTNPNNLTQTLGVKGDGQASSLLPGKLGSVNSVLPGKLNPLQYKHPLVRPFRGFVGGGLIDIPLWRYVPQEIGPQAEVALALENGNAILTTCRVGRGKVIVWGSSASELSLDQSVSPAVLWSAFSTWPSFPPLAHEMVNYTAATQAEDRQFLTGSVLHGVLTPKDSHDVTLELQSGKGRGEKLTAEVLETGVHWEAPPRSRGGSFQLLHEAKEKPLREISVNATRTESALELLDRSQLPPFVHIEAQTAGDSMDLSLPSISTSQPWFQTALLCAMGLLFGESLLLLWPRGKGT